jgi:fatty acid desaturase
VFRYSEDRLPVLLLLTLFAVDVAIFAFVDSVPLLAAWTILGIIPKGCFCAYNHHHQHVATFEQNWLNRILEQVYALQTGVFSNAWVLHHTLGHHVNYLDQSKDESGWMTNDGATMGPLRYTLWNAVLAYPRAWRVGRQFPKHRRALVGSALFIGALLTCLLLWRPLPALFVFVLPMMISLLGTVFATHAHHSGKRTDSHFVACNNTLHRGYNVMTGNLGYHTAHHYKPGVHWSRLPALHAEIAARVPDDCYLEASLPYTFVDHVTNAATATVRLVQKLLPLRGMSGS